MVDQVIGPAAYGDKLTDGELIEALAATHLGKVGAYTKVGKPCDANLLVKIPRSLNRQQHDLLNKQLPWNAGFDVWHAYEVSVLTNQGLPVNFILKLVLPANSEYHVESKSLKLYLNSFNLHQMTVPVSEVQLHLEQHIRADLSLLLGAAVEISLHQVNRLGRVDKYVPNGFEHYRCLSEYVDLSTIDFNERTADALLKVHAVSVSSSLYSVRCDLLRSNCRVTNQPDWGDVFITFESVKSLEWKSLAKYLVSHRQVNHFHEEVCELIYRDLFKLLNPSKLLVACLYTRRGGIDINPVRASDDSLVPKYFTSSKLSRKLVRQ